MNGEDVTMVVLDEQLASAKTLVACLLVVSCLCHPAKGHAAEPFPAYVTDACGSSAWLLPFDQDSAELSAFARERVASLVQAWKVDGGPITASGRVDGAEEGHDLALAGRRLEAVSKALGQLGVPPTAVWTRDDGGSRGLVENRSGTPEAQNRIVLATLARGGEHCEREMLKARTEWLRRNCLPTASTENRVVCEDALARLDHP